MHSVCTGDCEVLSYSRIILELPADVMEYLLDVAVRMVLFDVVEVVLTFVLYGVHVM